MNILNKSAERALSYQIKFTIYANFINIFVFINFYIEKYVYVDGNNKLVQKIVLNKENGYNLKKTQVQNSLYTV